MNGDVDKATTVVAQVEDELGNAAVLQGLEGPVERVARRTNEIAEMQVANLATVHFEHAGERHGWNRHQTFGHRRFATRTAARHEHDGGLDANLGRAKGAADSAVRDLRGHWLSVDLGDARAAIESSLERRTTVEHRRDVHRVADDLRREAEADELAVF